MHDQLSKASKEGQRQGKKRVEEPLFGLVEGRARQDSLQLNQLNGWMETSEAERLCEDNQQCGGFTFFNEEALKGQEIYTEIIIC